MAPPFTKGVKLPSGAVLPRIGLGVYRSEPGKETFEAVLNALRGGYRHVDTAQFYHNEADVGRAVAESEIPRSQVFVTTKLWLTEWGYDKTCAAVKRSVETMNLGYIDLMLLHAPGNPQLRPETWRALEDCRNRGLLRDIGVSNFGQAHLKKLAETATIPPAVNQVEIYPFLQRRDLVKYCQDQNIIVEAYSPLAKATKLADPVVAGIAYRKGAVPAQVLIAWSLAKGFVTLPKSINPERQRSNLESADLVLTEAEIAELDGLEGGLVTGWDPVTQDPV